MSGVRYGERRFLNQARILRRGCIEDGRSYAIRPPSVDWDSVERPGPAAASREPNLLLCRPPLEAAAVPRSSRAGTQQRGTGISRLRVGRTVFRLSLSLSARCPVLPHPFRDGSALSLGHRALPLRGRRGHLLPAASVDGPSVPLDRIDCALYGDELTLERVLLAPQRLQNSALRHRDLLLCDEPARISCAGRRHARHPGTSPDATETDRVPADTILIRSTDVPALLDSTTRGSRACETSVLRSAVRAVDPRWRRLAVGCYRPWQPDWQLPPADRRGERGGRRPVVRLGDRARRRGSIRSRRSAPALLVVGGRQRHADNFGVVARHDVAVGEHRMRPQDGAVDTSPAVGAAAAGRGWWASAGACDRPPRSPLA